MSNENTSSEVSENFTADNMESLSNSSNELQICEDDAPLITLIKKPRRARKRRRSTTTESSSDDESKIDQQMEDRLVSVASKINLTPQVVKNILKKVVGNDHVLALVKIQEENELKEEKLQRTIEEDNSPKLTRAKAKELNESILPIIPIQDVQTSFEVTALTQDELHSDIEDDEYQPCEDDINSDDETSQLTMSDIDSQPRTPATPNKSYEREADTPIYDDDGVFKIPPIKLTEDEEPENIYRRTRSKLCLETTDIETIESTFVPPDITHEMYDFDCNGDDIDWVQFLNDFTKPYSHTHEEDEEADPEYDMTADKIPVDAEEHRNIDISRREHSDLMKELMEIIGFDDDDLRDDQLITPPLTQPIQSKQSSRSKKPRLDLNPAETSTNLFRPNCMSTPVQPVRPISRIPQNQYLLDNSITQSPALQQSSIIYIRNPNNSNELIPISNINILAGSVINNGVYQVPEYQQIMIQIPTIDLLKSQSFDQSKNSSFNKTDDTITEVAENLKLKCDEVLEVPVVEENYDLSKQRLILEQQIRMHVQLASQNFIQTFGNPSYWEKASCFKTMLDEMNETTKKNPKSVLNVCNLKLAVNFCDKWVKDLSIESDENSKYINFMMSQFEKSKHCFSRKLGYIPQFHKRMIDSVLDSKVFIYPQLLPKIPLKYDVGTKKHPIISSEAYLIARGLEYFSEVCFNQINKYRHKNYRASKPSLQMICNHIAEYICLPKSRQHVYFYVSQQKNPKLPPNPIQYFFKHKRAPPIVNELDPLNLNEIKLLRDYPENVLPLIWDRYLHPKTIEDIRVIENADQPILSKKIATTPIEANYSPIKFRIILDNEIPVDCQIEDNVEIDVINHLKPPSTEELITHIQKDKIIFSDSSNNYLDVSCIEKTPPYASAVSLPNLDESERIEETDFSDSSVYVGANSENRHNFRSYNFLSISKRKINLLRTTIKRAVSKFDEEYNSRHSLRYTKYNNILTKLYKHFKYFNIYMNLLQESMLENSSIKRPKMMENISSQENEMSPITNKRTSNKNQKLLDSERSILLKETPEEIEEKDAVYAQNFYDKVEEKYKSEGKLEKFEEFVEILNNFDQKNDKVPDLYRKLEKLFLPDHPEFAETFISILLPGHAAQIGKFIEHRISTNMNTFCNKLNIYFKKQPAQTRRIYSCINELSNDTNVTMEMMKTKILPLLKGNQLLIDWFLQIFPSERIPESTADEYESLVLKNNLTADEGTDSEVYETILQTDLMPDPVENSPCGTKYIQGRIYYGSRFPLPGRLSFLAFDEESSIQPINTTNEPSTSASTTSECIHAIRKIGDEKLLEMNLTNSEIISSLNAIHGNENDEDENDLEILPNLCSTSVLRAHGIRLNPVVHGSNITNPTEVLKILTIPENKINFNEISYLKDSPTKQITKNIYKKNPASPTVKKNKSPINRKSSVTSLVDSDSPAIAISRKLKNLVETDNSEDEKTPRRNSVKKSPKTDDDSESDSGKNRTPKSKAKKRSRREWSRKEDKIILEEIKNVAGVEGALVDRLIGQLKYRSLSEISERSNYLEDILRQFQNK